MLGDQVREVLKIPEQGGSPLREAWITGSATAFGAFLPIFPFFVLGGTSAIVTSFVVAMASHFLVGAARSILTGRARCAPGWTCSSWAWASPWSGITSGSGWRGGSSTTPLGL